MASRLQLLNYPAKSPQPRGRHHKNVLSIEEMNKDETIIGYFAATNRGDVICDGPACIIAGSYKTMKD